MTQVTTRTCLQVRSEFLRLSPALFNEHALSDHIGNCQGHGREEHACECKVQIIDHRGHA
jgi:hypothetical protein